jgi:Protein of unknown function (DUF3421)
MRRADLWILFAFVLASACTATRLEKPGVRTSQSLESAAIEAIEAKAPQTEDAEVTKEEEGETVVPPSNIAGSFLICEPTQVVLEGDIEAQVQCALRDESTKSKVDLKTRFSSYAWKHEWTGTSTLTVSAMELSNSLDWHVSYLVKGSQAAEFRAQLATLRLLLQVVDKDGIQRQAQGGVTTTQVAWLSLNGSPIPSQAALGGTWNGTVDPLYICRLHVNNEVLPGKLLVHYNDPNKSICYSINTAGQSIQSQSENAQNLLIPNDVLVIAQGNFSDYLEWVPAQNGQLPARAFASGLDSQGRALYTCRGEQMARAEPDLTPGVLRPGASSCVHEFELYEERRNNYQVLAWKANIQIQ